MTCEFYAPFPPAFINHLMSHSQNKTRSELVVMVQRQQENWPWKDSGQKFSPSKTRIDVLRSALLNPSFGFTLADMPASGPRHLENEGGLHTETEGEGSHTQGSGGDAGGLALVRCSFHLYFLCHFLIVILGKRHKGVSHLY